MSTSTATPTTAEATQQPATPKARISFDPFKHAHLFSISALNIQRSRNGHPQIDFTCSTAQGDIRAGTITLVAARPATLAGQGMQESLILNGRLAEFTEVNREHLKQVGARFASEKGDASRSRTGEAKTFWTVFIPTAAIDKILPVMREFKTKNDKFDATGRFTANAIEVFMDKYRTMQRNNPLG